MSVTLWLARADELDTGPAQNISAEEREQAERYRAPGARQRFLASRALVRTQLAGATGAQPTELRFARTDNGKPYLPDYPATHFNLSHSGDWIALAIADFPIGVDIEHPRKPRPYLDIARQYFHPDEHHYLSALDTEALADAFYRLWTLKEAFFKARGTGIAEGLGRVRFDEGNRPQMDGTDTGWYSHYQCPEPGLHLACAGTQAAASEPTIRTDSGKPLADDNQNDPLK